MKSWVSTLASGRAFQSAVPLLLCSIALGGCAVSETLPAAAVPMGETQSRRANEQVGRLLGSWGYEPLAPATERESVDEWAHAKGVFPANVPVKGYTSYIRLREPSIGVNVWWSQALLKIEVVQNGPKNAAAAAQELARLRAALHAGPAGLAVEEAR